MGWLITLGVLILLAVLPLGVLVRYNEDGPQVKIIAGPVRLQVVPGKKKEEQKPKPKKKKDKTVKAEKKPNSAAPQGDTKKKGGHLGDFMPLVQLALEFFGTFTRKLRINRLDLNLVLAGSDPCDLAINYGKAWTALGNLWPRLEEIFVIRKRNVQVQCDFEAEATHITACLDITITLGRLLHLVLSYGIRALMQYMKITNKGKGGAAI